MSAATTWFGRPQMDTMNHLKAKYGDPPWLAYPNATGTPAIHQVLNKAFAALGKHRLAR